MLESLSPSSEYKIFPTQLPNFNKCQIVSSVIFSMSCVFPPPSKLIHFNFEIIQIVNMSDLWSWIPFFQNSFFFFLEQKGVMKSLRLHSVFWREHHEFQIAFELPLIYRRWVNRLVNYSKVVKYLKHTPLLKNKQTKKQKGTFWWFSG